MKTLRVLFLSVFLLTLGVPTALGLDADRIYGHLLTKYYQEQATSDVFRVLGNNPYFVKATVKLRAQMLQKEKETGTPIRLPLSKVTLDDREFKKLSADSFGPETLHELLSLVESARINVTVEAGLKDSIRQMISAQILDGLKLASVTQRDIVFSEASSDWTKYRDEKERKEIKIVQESSTNSSGTNSIGEKIEAAVPWSKNPIFVIGGVLTIIALALVALIIGIRSIAREIREYTGKLISAVKETSEHIQPPSQRTPESTASAQSNRPAPGNMPEQGDFWLKADIQVIASFIHDIESQPRWRGITGSILNQALTPERSAKLEELIGSVDLLGEPSIDIDRIPSFLQEASFFIQNHLAEYRRINRSPLGQLASQLGLEELVALEPPLNPFEKAILINSLLPVTKDLFVKEMSIETRLAIVKSGERQIPTSEMKSYEFSLTLALERATAQHGRRPAEQKTMNMSYLTQGILSSKSFEEDETMFLKSKELGFEYRGVLLLLDQLEESLWSQINLSELALTTYGYSDATLQRFKDKFHEKRAQWFENFLKKAQEGRPEFNSRELFTAREQLLHLLNTTENNENKAA